MLETRQALLRRRALAEFDDQDGDRGDVATPADDMPRGDSLQALTPGSIPPTKIYGDGTVEMASRCAKCGTALNARDYKASATHCADCAKAMADEVALGGLVAGRTGGGGKVTSAIAKFAKIVTAPMSKAAEDQMGKAPSGGKPPSEKPGVGKSLFQRAISKLEAPVENEMVGRSGTSTPATGGGKQDTTGGLKAIGQKIADVFEAPAKDRIGAREVAVKAKPAVWRRRA